MRGEKKKKRGRGIGAGEKGGRNLGGGKEAPKRQKGVWQLHFHWTGEKKTLKKRRKVRGVGARERFHEGLSHV